MKILTREEIREIISTPKHPFKDWAILDEILSILEQEGVTLQK